MIMMFGEAGSMMETASPEWIKEMIGFMADLDRELTESGELEMSGDRAGARAAYRRALKKTASGPEQHYLALRAARLG
jgi:hypothetical protein